MGVYRIVVCHDCKEFTDLYNWNPSGPPDDAQDIMVDLYAGMFDHRHVNNALGELSIKHVYISFVYGHNGHKVELLSDEYSFDEYHNVKKTYKEISHKYLYSGDIDKQWKNAIHSYKIAKILYELKKNNKIDDWHNPRFRNVDGKPVCLFDCDVPVGRIGISLPISKITLPEAKLKSLIDNLVKAKSAKRTK